MSMLGARRGTAAHSPNGRIVPGAGVNAGRSWHLEDIEFVEVASELCDGRLCDVERGSSGEVDSVPGVRGS